MNLEELALFPLRAVVFPGTRLPLRIFERRYVDLIRTCLREERGFGIPPIRYGNEAGVPATPWPCGTLVRIRDFSQGDDGLLHIEVEGVRRFRLLDQAPGEDGVLRGKVEWLEAAAGGAPAPADDDLREVLSLLAPSAPLAVPVDALDAEQVVYRLLERLPIPVELQVDILLSDSVGYQQARCRDLLARVLAQGRPEAH